MLSKLQIIVFTRDAWKKCIFFTIAWHEKGCGTGETHKNISSHTAIKVQMKNNSGKVSRQKYITGQATGWFGVVVVFLACPIYLHPFILNEYQIQDS